MKDVPGSHACEQQAGGGFTVDGNSGFACKPVSAQALVANDGQSKTDAYSVLASFGSESSGSGKGKIAQYIATGHAARALASKGGASLVNEEAVDPEVQKALEELTQTRGAQVTTILLHVASDGKVDKTRWDALLGKTTYKDDPTLKTMGDKQLTDLEKELNGPSAPAVPELASAVS